MFSWFVLDGQSLNAWWGDWIFETTASTSTNGEQNEYAANDVTNGFATATSDVNDGPNQHGDGWYGNGNGNGNGNGCCGHEHACSSFQHYRGFSSSSPHCFHAHAHMGWF